MLKKRREKIEDQEEETAKQERDDGDKEPTAEMFMWESS
jgi:hypothetical protein